MLNALEQCIAHVGSVLPAQHFDRVDANAGIARILNRHQQPLPDILIVGATDHFALIYLIQNDTDPVRTIRLDVADVSRRWAEKAGSFNAEIAREAVPIDKTASAESDEDEK